MKRILQNYIQELCDRGKYLGDPEEIISLLDGIKTEYLYKSDFHGLYHSQKVCFFAYLIGKHEGLSDEDMQILMDAARYHDIGRDSDYETDLHGFNSALNIHKVVKYDNPTNMYYLKAIVEAHAHEDSSDQKVFSHWYFEKLEEDKMLNRETDELSYERFLKLSDILKDADALDRLRFRNCPAVLDEKYLRVDYSKNLIDISRVINDYYLKVEVMSQYDKLKNRYDVDSYDKKICYHSVGFDFFKALSILNGGIISYYNSVRNNIKISRNFNGNNGEFWISVVEADSGANNHEAYDRYVKNAISFLCYVNELVPGVDRVKDNGSSLPRSGQYADEKFVFDKIPLEHIQFISIPRNLMNKSIKDLEYLYCNSQYELVKMNVHNYLDEIEEYCDIKINRKPFENVLKDIEQIQIEFNNSSRGEAKMKSKEYFEKVDHMKAQLNIYLQEWMQTGFAELLGKNFDEEITLAEVMSYILKKNGIDYQVVDNMEGREDSPLFINFPFYQDNDSFLLRLSTFDLNKNISYDEEDIKIR